MWKRRRSWLALLALTGVALAVYFEPTHCVRGWLWGEAFFEGRPTSYWRGVVERDMQTDPRVFLTAPFTPAAPSPWDRGLKAIGIRPRPTDFSLALVRSLQADAVLDALADDANARIAEFAKDVVQDVRPRQPFDPNVDAEYFAWWQLICQHHREPQDFDKLLAGGNIRDLRK